MRDLCTLRLNHHLQMIIATFRQKQHLFGSPAKASAAPSSSSAGKCKSKVEVITISDSETETDTDNETGSGNAAQPKQPLGWAYVGSHNFTPSAWGTLSGSGFNPVLNVCCPVPIFFCHEVTCDWYWSLQNVNYELGILFPLYSEEEIERVSCFKRPPRKYVLGEDRPWVSSLFGNSTGIGHGPDAMCRFRTNLEYSRRTVGESFARVISEPCCLINFARQHGSGSCSNFSKVVEYRALISSSCMMYRRIGPPSIETVKIRKRELV